MNSVSNSRKTASVFLTHRVISADKLNVSTTNQTSIFEAFTQIGNKSRNANKATGESGSAGRYSNYLQLSMDWTRQMHMKKLIASALLLTPCAGAYADAYKCELIFGPVSYQQSACPELSRQNVIRIYDNSARIQADEQQAVNPWLAEMMAEEKLRQKTEKAREKRQHRARERMEYAALMKAPVNEDCAKYQALYRKQNEQGGVKVIDIATGEPRIDKSEKSLKLIDQNKEKMGKYCN